MVASLTRPVPRSLARTSREKASSAPKPTGPDTTSFACCRPRRSRGAPHRGAGRRLVFAHFDSPTTRVNADHEPAIGWCPTSRWKSGQTIVDRVVVPQFDQPGRYALEIGFFTGSAPNWQNLAISAAPSSMVNRSDDGVHLADIVIK